MNSTTTAALQREAKILLLEPPIFFLGWQSDLRSSCRTLEKKEVLQEIVADSW